jgi:hypothetical protein
MSKQPYTQTKNNIKSSNLESIIRHLFWHKMLGYKYPLDYIERDEITITCLKPVKINEDQLSVSGAVEEWLQHNDI